MGCCWKQVAATLVAALVAASHAGAEFTVFVSREDGEGPVLCVSLEERVRFHLDFINSIYLAPVRETFEYEPLTGISLVSVESSSPGVFEYYGLMTDGTGKAELRRVLGKSIRLLSHDYQHHRLAAGDRSIELTGYALNGRPLLIEARSGRHCTR